MKLLGVNLPVRAVWIWAVLILGVFIFPFCWYFVHLAFLELQSTGSSLIDTLETNSTTSDGIEVFFTNADKYMLVLALLGLGLFAFRESQRKGLPMYE